MGTAAKIIGIEPTSISKIDGIGIADISKLGGQTVETTSYLLDTYGTGVEAAWSVRLLSSTYTGYCMKIRVVDGVTDPEYDIGFVAGELDTADILTKAGSDDTRVVTWYDQTGNGNDATQGYAPSQYQIADSGSIFIGLGSKPALDALNQNAYYNITLSTSLTQPCTHFIVTEPHNKHNRASFGEVATQKTSGHFTTYYLNAGINLTNTTRTVHTSLGTSFFDGTDSEYWVDGVSVISGDAGANDSTKIYLGYGSMEPGVFKYFQEYIVFDADKTSDRVAIETEMSTYYSITYPGSGP